MHQCWLKIHQSCPFCHLVSNNLVSSMWQSTSEPSVKNFEFLTVIIFIFLTWNYISILPDMNRNHPKWTAKTVIWIIYSIQRFAFAFDKTNIKILQFACLLWCQNDDDVDVKCQYMHFCREYDINELRSAFGNSFTHFEWWYWGKPEQRNLDLDLLGLFQM